MIIGIESLNRMFEHNCNANSLSYMGKCHHCGCDVEVEITRTSGGYGLQGGALYEPKPQKILVLCVDCYIFSSKPKSSLKQLLTEAA